MKYALPVLALLCHLACSCAPREEVIPPPAVVVPPPEIPRSPVDEKKEPGPPVVVKSVLICTDDTREVFNRCGLEVLPFVRPVFFDIYHDGNLEMITGTKEGGLLLYKNIGTPKRPSWKVVEGYFNGVKASAFSSPAMGDIDGDGRPELLVGTGGFSSDSGRVILYRNSGTLTEPAWEQVDMPEIRVGSDAAPVLFSHDGRLDLIVGNSTGNLFFFRNRSRGGRIVFKEERDFFKGIKLGMYAVPAAVSVGSRILVIAGNDMGKLVILERMYRRDDKWKTRTLRLHAGTFAAPTFVETSDPGEKDLVVSDSNGRILYFRNGGDYRQWREDPAFFSGRILPGPASAPSRCEMDGRQVMVIGNIYGELRLLEYISSGEPLPWVERPDFFGGIKLPGFSHGLLTQWQGEYLLITGQQDGMLRAFRRGREGWTEVNGFFNGLPVLPHAAPAVFDLDKDGKWDLMVGDAEGRVHGFRYTQGEDGLPVWEPLKESFRSVKVERFATPSLYREGDMIYLLVGQQDGRIKVFRGETASSRTPVFEGDDDLAGVRVRNHSSPTALFSSGQLDLTVGDYDGNLRHYACVRTTVAAHGK